MFPKHYEVCLLYGQQKCKISLWRLCWNSHSEDEDEMRLCASFQLLDFLYCAKPCTNYLASKPKGPSQEKSLLNVMHHMLSSVMHSFQEGTEKKNRTFFYLNFKDWTDVRVTHEICFLTAPFQLSRISHFPSPDRNDCTLKASIMYKNETSRVFLQINNRTSTFFILILGAGRDTAFSRWLSEFKGLPPWNAIPTLGRRATHANKALNPEE